METNQKVIDGKRHNITSQPKHRGALGDPAGNKKLRAVAENYGVYKNLTDVPHWSVEVGGK